ncbi:hypothetical protein [Rhodoligotrophos defluvii]|uniref:hypothetical protein n=1 Tax=Rhodoligotrophos defluvii TaxID=2561934 RepID=UPI0014853582|nr:hypothetical protein [Rhodoligotrophos defluvii]
MHLNPPSLLAFLISIILAGLAMAGKITPLPYISANVVWLLLAAYLVLAFGCLQRGL